MKRLEGKVAIITGSNSGVGEETAKLFAAEGASVVICARRKEALENALKAIEEMGGKALAVPTDISKEEDIKVLMEETIKTFGKIDILVNNAGVLDTNLNPIDCFTDEDFDRVTNINEKGTMMVIREALKYMKETKTGSIVNVASVAGQYGCGGAVYVASKASMIGITKHTAMRFASTGIRCNAVCPGSIITPMTTGIDQTKINMDMMTAMMKHSDIRGCRPCMAKDVADIIIFLASDESRALTGQIIVSDYGVDL
ncbi:MAG: SDR family oxidoreductase [Bacilli bacterium]